MRKGVPGVVRCAIVAVQPDRTQRELHSMGLAHHHHARPRQLRNCAAILLGDVVGQELRSSCRGHAFDVIDILDRVGDAVKRPAILPAAKLDFGGARLGDCPFPGNMNERMQGAVQCLDPRKKPLGHGYRTERTASVFRAER